MKKILIVGGTWNENGGMPSSIIKKMASAMNQKLKIIVLLRLEM